MKKISLTFLAALLSIVQLFSQTDEPTSNYETRKLKVEEINLVGSYYHQDGNNSAVTGGVGTELLTDFSNSFDLKLSKIDKKNRKHVFGVEMGFDTYTSASSDNIDPNTITSSSYTDQRYYPSLSWSMSDAENTSTFGANISYSREWDYYSKGAGLSYRKAFNENNTEINLRANVFLDKWWLIYPVELTPDGYAYGNRKNFSELTYKPRNSFNFSAALSQIVNERLQVSLIVEPNFQKGQLSTPYQRVYFNTPDSVRIEKLPTERWKVPIGARANYFINGNVLLRTFYRYYFDQWGLKAHTVELELPIKISPFVSITPSYRFYKQNGIGYFGAINTHSLNDQFYTSDYDLSKLHSNAYGLNLRYKPLNGILGMKHWSKAEIRYQHYQRSTSLSSNIVTLLLEFK